MQHRSSLFMTISITLVATLMLGAFPPAAFAAQAPRRRTRVSTDEGGETIYLPWVTDSSPAPPSFVIDSPAPDGIIAGTVVFAAQVTGPGAVTRVDFRAGNSDLGLGIATAGGFQVYIDADQLPAGPITLTATAVGPGGSASQSVDVTVQHSPLASASVGPQGAVIASQTGSVITVPPGGAPPGTHVSVVEKTQDQVTADTGINWDALGVTFLGAQQISSDHAFRKPLSIASAGYGQRVQPGQAVVTYQIVPDSNNDHVAELVAVNGASVVSKTQAVVSDPVPKIQLGAIQRVGKAGSVAFAAATLSGPPGATFEIAAAGLNPASAQGNVAIFQTPDGGGASIPAFVRFDPQSPLGQTAQVMIPLLPPGPATLTLRNESTGNTSALISVTIDPLGPPSKPAGQIIDQAFVTGEAALNQLQSDLGSQAAIAPSITNAISHTKELRTFFQQIAAHPTTEQAKVLDNIASMIENSNILLSLPASSAELTQGICNKLGPLSLITGATASFGGMLTGLGLSAGALTVGGGAFVLAGGGVFLLSVAVGFAIGVGVSCLFDNPPPVCTPSPMGSGAGTTGNGATIPSGGASCGGAGGGSGSGGGSGGPQPHAAAVNGATASQYIVKVFPKNGGPALTPFTGATDPGGYFYIPIIPAGQAFKAIATDRLTGASTTFEGIGPQKGDFVYMIFDFSNVPENRFAINIGETISNGVPAPGAGNIELPGGEDVYTFNAFPGAADLCRYASACAESRPSTLAADRRRRRGNLPQQFGEL